MREEQKKIGPHRCQVMNIGRIFPPKEGPYNAKWLDCDVAVCAQCLFPLRTDFLKS